MKRNFECIAVLKTGEVVKETYIARDKKTAKVKFKDLLLKQGQIKSIETVEIKLA